MKRLQAKIEQEGVLRSHHGAHVAHEMHSDLGAVCRRAEVIGIDNAVICLVRLSEHGILAVSPVKPAAVHHNAAKGAGVTVHVFAGGMNHYVRAEFDGAAVDGGGEGVVHHNRHTVGMRRVHPFFQIQHSEGGIGEHLGKDASCVVFKEPVDLLDGSVRVDEVHFQTHVAEGLVEEVEGAAIDGGGTDQVVARLADIQHRIHRSCLT